MAVDDKSNVRHSLFTDLFLRYGGGAHHVQLFMTVKHWNWIAWGLIALGAAFWVVFLHWNPA